MAISQVTSGKLITPRHDLHRQQLVQLSRDSLPEALLPVQSRLQIQHSQLRNNDQNVFKPSALDLPTANMPRERYFSSKEESRRLDMKQRKPFEGTLAVDVTGLTSKVHDLHASSGFQGFVGGLDRCSEPRLHDTVLLDRKYEALYRDTGVNTGEKFESSVFPARALYNGLAEQVFGHPNPHAHQMAATLGYPCGDARIPPTALTLPTPVSPELAGGPRSLKTVDPLTLSRILLDQQVVAMAQMQQLRLLQQSYLASGNPLYLLPENLMPADLEVLWHLKHPGLPLPPAWTTLPWVQDDSGMGADLRLKEMDLRSKDIRRYQEHLKYGKLETPRTDPGMPLEGVDRTRFLREGTEASEMARTAADFMPGSDCHSKEKKCRERKTFMENEKQGFSVERVKRDRRWLKMESKSGISEHPHPQNWLEAGATEPASQLQRNFAMPGFRQSDRKREMGRNEVGCTSDYRKYEWPGGRASLNEERTRKPSENDTPDALQVSLTRPSSYPHSRNSDGLHPHNAGYAFSDRNEDFLLATERMKDGQPLPPDWFSSMERAKHHVKNVSQFPGGVYKGRTGTYRYSQEHVPTDIAHKSPTTSEAMLQHGNSEMKMLSSVKNSRHSFYPHNRHMNGTANDTNLETRNGIGPEAGCGFVPTQNGARDLFLQQSIQQAALSRFSASEAQKLGIQENRGMHDDWEKTEASQRRFYHQVPNDVPSEFPGIPYSGSAGTLGPYPTYLNGLSTSSVGASVSSPSNSHYVYSHRALASRLQMPSLSPIASCEVLQSRRASRWTEGVNSNNTKKLKLDLPRSIDSPLPSWMNKSTFSALSTNCIDSFKSFVDHTVQNAFINEMKEAESCSTAKANEAKLKTEVALEDCVVGRSSASRNCPSEDIPVAADSGILTASSMDSLSSHPLSTETSGATSSSSHCSTLPTAEMIPCCQETPMSAGSDSGLPLQLSETGGVHTKFKKTWLRNYLDQDRKLSSDSCTEYHQSSDTEMLSSKDNGDQCNGMDYENEELPDGDRCATDSVIELIDLSSVKKLSQA